MGKKYRVKIFGKKGCEKCRVLKERFDALLTKEEWTEFEQQYCDVETEEGLLSFVKLEALNPQRIPAFIVEKTAGPGYEPLLNPEAGDNGQGLRPWKFIGLQTDYSEQGKGIITPKMVTDILNRARAL